MVTPNSHGPNLNWLRYDRLGRRHGGGRRAAGKKGADYA